MRIIYRMRGLLGDATEEFIESLDSTTGNALVSWKLGLDLKSEVRCRAVTLLSPELTVDWHSLCCVYLLHLVWRRILAAVQVCALNTNASMALGCSAWPSFMFLLISRFKFDTVSVAWTVGKCALLCSGFAFMICLCPVDEEEDEEEVYKMAGVMAQCGGLECMLNRLTGIKDFKQGRHLLTVSLNFSSLESEDKLDRKFHKYEWSFHFWLPALCCILSVGTEVSIYWFTKNKVIPSFPLPFLFVNNSLRRLWGKALALLPREVWVPKVIDGARMGNLGWCGAASCSRGWNWLCFKALSNPIVLFL
mgnify:FL=1